MSNWKGELKKKVIDGDIFMQDKGGQKRRCFDLVSYEDAINFIESLLKRQRENCTKILDTVYDSTEWRDTRTLRQAILNAPEPKGD